MRRLLASLSCLLPLSVIELRGAPQDPEASPPPFRLTVTIDGVEHQLVDGVARQIELGGKQVALKAKVAPLRHFAAAGVEFDYPREMVFGFEAGRAERTWTLEGRGVTVTVTEVATGTVAERLDGLFKVMRQIEEHAGEVESCTVRFGGSDQPAKRLSTSLDSIMFEHLAFGIDRRGGGAVTIDVQQMLELDGSRSPECQRLLELFEHTLVMATK